MVPNRFVPLLLVAALGLSPLLPGLSPGALAQEAAEADRAQPNQPAPANQNQQQNQQQPARTQPERRDAGLSLPPDTTARQVLELPGRTLRYTVRAGSIDIRDTEGRLRAEVAFTAYTLDGQPAAARPVSFALNGGPGASSAYLHFAAIGPKRIAIGNEGDTPSKPPVLIPNEETWLDQTDLVFIDPPGTGYSRVVGGDEVARQTFSVDGDISLLARVVQRWLAENGRLASPKYLIGESYGGFRLPKLAARLQTGEGVGINGLALVSPVIDFSLRLRGGESHPVALAARLPSLVAAAREKQGGEIDRAGLAEVEAYAFGEYLVDIVKGEGDKAAVARMVDRVAAFTGLPRAFVARSGGQIEPGAYLRELFRDAGRVGSLYDGSVTSLDPNPNGLRSSYEDPVLDAMSAPLTSAAIAFTRDELNWRPTGRYELLSRDVNRRWNWGGGLSAPESASDLRQAIALDPNLRVLVTHGLTDLVTTYMESKYVLDQLPSSVAGDRVRLAVYPGGHMFYSRDASRQAFRRDAAWLFGASAR